MSNIIIGVLTFILMFLSSLVNGQVAGKWIGTVESEEGNKSIEFTISDKDGTLSSLMAIPGQGIQDIPMSSTKFENNQLTIAFDAAALTYSGELMDDKVVGVLSAQGKEKELTLHKEKQAESVDLSKISSEAKQYPAPSAPVTEEYFGIQLTDEYRNLEDLKNEETLKWMKSQADYTTSVIHSIPGRQKILDKLVEIDGRRSESISGLEILDNDMYFYLKTTPQDQTGKLFYRQGFKGKETLLFDPEQYGKEENETYTISGTFPNYIGTKVGIAISSKGKEVSDILVMDVKTKKISPNKIEGLRFAYCNWLADNQSFLYNKTASSDIHDMEAQSDLRTYLHKVGTPVSADELIFSKENHPNIKFDEGDLPFVGYDKDEDVFMLFIYTVNPNFRIYDSPSKDVRNLNWTSLVERENEIQNFFINGNDLYFYTSKNAPKFKLMKTSLSNPDFDNAKTIIEEDSDYSLESISASKDGIYYTKSRNGVEMKLYFTDFNGKKHKEIKLPKEAATIGVETKGLKFSDTWVYITGWTTKGERYNYDLKKNKFKREQLSSIIEYPEFEDIVSEEVMVTSHDGVKVPLSLIYKKGLKKDKNTPVLFYGYGAYGISMTPAFNPTLLLWAEQGGIIAVAHVRGGGELGNDWHLAGQKTTKPNTWKDLIACTEYMINEGYTNPNKTAVYSRSAGGIFVGRAITERPDLYAAAIPGVGSMNPVRAEHSPNGPVNVPEFGTMEIEEEAKALIEMDSYHHLKDGTKYPATFITAGFNDPRVIVWSPAKFAAKMQQVNASDKPILLKVDYEAGHGMGDTKDKSFEDITDILSFALWQVGHEDFQP